MNAFRMRSNKISEILFFIVSNVPLSLVTFILIYIICCIVNILTLASRIFLGLLMPDKICMAFIINIRKIKILFRPDSFRPDAFKGTYTVKNQGDFVYWYGYMQFYFLIKLNAKEWLIIFKYELNEPVYWWYWTYYTYND